MPALMGFLRSLARRQGPISVREPTEEDMPAIETLAQRSPYAYSGYGGAMREALHDDITLTAWQEEALAGFTMAHQQGPAAAWIYAFGLAEDVSPSTVSKVLLEALEGRGAQRGVTQIGYMDEYSLSWLRRILEDGGFRRHTRVVGYEAPAGTPAEWGNRAVQVRPARPKDIAAITVVDHPAFGPLWAYGEQVFYNVLGEAACLDVAEQEGQIVGYILGMIHRGSHAHVVRLAVHPDWQGQGIGTRLLAEAFTLFRSQGHLYRRFGFQPTGQEVGVWVKAITPPAAADTAPPPAPSSSPPR